MFPALKLVTPTTSEPITISEVKSALLIDTSARDVRITTLIKAARQHIEEVYSIAFMPQTWAAYWQHFPCKFLLPKWPLAASPAVAITYLRSDGTTGTVSTDDYLVNPYIRPPQVKLRYQLSWPTDVLETVNPVTVQFAAGFANADAIPFDLKEALILVVERWLNNPSDIVLTNSGVANVAPLPYSSQIVFANYELVYA